MHLPTDIQVARRDCLLGFSWDEDAGTCGTGENQVLMIIIDHGGDFHYESEMTIVTMRDNDEDWSSISLLLIPSNFNIFFILSYPVSILSL